MGFSGCLPIFFFICLADSFPMKHEDEELVSATLCPMEYVYNNFTEKCYRVVTEPAELKFARELCSSDHASITEPVDEMERFMILAYAIEKLRPRSETFLWWGYEPKKCMALNDLGKAREDLISSHIAREEYAFGGSSGGSGGGGGSSGGSSTPGVTKPRTDVSCYLGP